MTKHIFIINPAAGQGEAVKLKNEIDAVCSVAGADYEIYETEAPGLAEVYVRKCCEDQAAAGENAAGTQNAADANAADTTLRFYSCGGDGTLNEVVNGAVGYDFAEVGCIPAGTGNDFVRNFPGRRFDSLVDQIKGESSLCDLIHYEGEVDGENVSRYCVNMFNIGFDSNVVDLTARMKRMPMITGSFAYLASVATMLIEKRGADLCVEYEDGFVHNGKLLLIAVANGCFCGGGVKGIPKAVTDDGVFDVSLVKNIPRHTFVRLFPKYMKGTHLGDKRMKNVIRYTHERSLTISPNRAFMKLCVDGEITKAGRVRFEIRPKAFRFVVPAITT